MCLRAEAKDLVNVSSVPWWEGELQEMDLGGSRTQPCSLLSRSFDFISAGNGKSLTDISRRVYISLNYLHAVMKWP